MMTAGAAKRRGGCLIIAQHHGNIVEPVKLHSLRLGVIWHWCNAALLQKPSRAMRNTSETLQTTQMMSRMNKIV